MGGLSRRRYSRCCKRAGSVGCWWKAGGVLSQAFWLRLADAVTASVRRFSLGSDICTVFDFAAARQLTLGQSQNVAMPNLNPENSERELGAS